MILSQEEKEYFQLFNDIIMALYADSNVEPLLVICRQCIANEAEIFSSMSRHLEMMRKRNNDIQNAQYLKNLVNGVISMLGNENIVLYDNIEELDVQLRKQIKISLATFKSLGNEFVKNKPIGDICQYIRENSFLKEVDARLILVLKKLYSDVKEIDEDDKDILVTLLKYFLFDMQHPR